MYNINKKYYIKKNKKILNKTKKYCKLDENNNIPIILVGNKNDFKFLRNISFADAQQRANQLNCELKEINCNKDIENVHDVMKHIISKIYYNNLNEEEKEKIKNKAKQFYDINNN